jgi:hypothetical protein
LGVFARRFRLTPEHAGNFVDAFGTLQQMDFRNRAPFVLTFCNDEVRGRGRRDWRQMRDTDNLMRARNLQHLFANDTRRFAADVGVDFVED